MEAHRYDQLLGDLRHYRDEREWQRFHTPKDLAIALTVETAELLEHFLWRTAVDVEEHLAGAHEEVVGEVADIGIYLLYLCDQLGIDLLDAAERKRRRNLERHPLEATKGRARGDAPQSPAGS